MYENTILEISNSIRHNADVLEMFHAHLCRDTNNPYTQHLLRYIKDLRFISDDLKSAFTQF
jgi:DNA-binding FadR family transcriptional regulator